MVPWAISVAEASPRTVSPLEAWDPAVFPAKEWPASCDTADMDEGMGPTAAAIEPWCARTANAAESVMRTPSTRPTLSALESRRPCRTLTTTYVIFPS